MDIKKALLDLLEVNLRSRYYKSIEMLIFTMLQDYLENQNKGIISGLHDQRLSCDMVFPDGIDGENGRIAVEIRPYRNSRMTFRLIYDVVGKFAMRNEQYDKLLFIAVSEIPEAIKARIELEKQKLGFPLIFWDINDLVEIFEKNTSLFEEIYNNLNTRLLQETISRGIGDERDTYKEKLEEYIRNLQNEYDNDNIVLFLGAGASKDAKVATWDSLISQLFIALIDKQLPVKNMQMNENEKEAVSKALMGQNGNSPLLQTRFLKNNFEEAFEELIGEILYKEAEESSHTLEEIGQLCIPRRGKFGIQAIVNYNFDDLIEKNLTRLRVKYHSIYGEGMIPSSEEVGIYHVHGFLPQDKEGYEDLGKSLLVFSEEGYHKLMLEPYNWANISQLNFMINNTCVFIGLSMTDPNMRRLLEIAGQKQEDGNERCKHYAIMKRLDVPNPKGTRSIEKFKRVNETLQESFYAELGINVIWVDDYKEIPNILKRIKGE